MYSKERLQQLSIRKIEQIKNLQMRIRNIQELKSDLFLPDNLNEAWNKDIKRYLLEIKQLAKWLDENTDLDMKQLLGSDCLQVL